MANKKAAVLVAGSWGTALATVLADNGMEVCLWSRREEQVTEINRRHTNSRFLKDTVLSEAIYATTSLEEAVRDAEAVILAATSASMREIAGKLQPYLPPEALLIHATKGFEVETMKRMTSVIAEELPSYDSRRIVVLSGPSHAEEVVLRCPTTIVVAAEEMEAAEAAQDLFINSHFRVYTNPDVTGVEIGGALKNIIALGAGLTDGLGFGDNAKAALMTRGLAEIARLGTAMGANPLTFAGLAGVGDLIATCTSKHSRNWRAGYMIGQGAALEEVLEKMGMVVEGVKTTQAAHILAQRYEVAMPITDALFRVLFEGKTPEEAVEDLMGRVRTHEIEDIAQEASAKWVP
ncbi:NAD(P)H-dependent glycerol-3-phosphate dehydrogenase [Paenibacillus aurantius]|uniref:Glycerol-3-phosphate dehydrogenase [NAD(P)+] n=1 Tax=Paenibacillus aurantius TaxID=2918900 RepID=A0AA96L9R3_9BACL|nr:NAD(P)H-dependent glycerol-3-phosphate dehydrogenase [Paenibacillus aurantius]WNQ09300.1 NAD(P)H-dependent glycerol-3-phosphate dehydrogenase [Paenibacillus aurantius]